MNEIKNKVPDFTHQMGRAQTVLGWCYIPMHIFVIPFLLALYAVYSPQPIGDIEVNLIYYAAGVVFTTIVMGTYLRRQFDVLLDNLPGCALVFLTAFIIQYSLSLVSALILMLLEENVINPNNEAVMSMAEQNYGVIKGLAVFIAPIVEEVLFRGVVFGSIRRKQRIVAYIASIVLFSIYHVWQYALAYDPIMLLYALQYIPVSFALAWAYERSGTIWVPIFFHMALNALSLTVLSAL